MIRRFSSPHQTRDRPRRNNRGFGNLFVTSPHENFRPAERILDFLSEQPGKAQAEQLVSDQISESVWLQATRRAFWDHNQNRYRLVSPITLRPDIYSRRT